MTLGLAERARGIDSNVGVIALSERGDRREGGADLERDAGKDQLLASGRLNGGCDFRIVPRVDRRAIDDVLSSHRFHELGEGRSPHAVAGRGGDDGWDPQHLGGLGQGDNVMLEFPGLVIAHAGHQADLMVDQHERGIVRGQGDVGLALIGHSGFLLFVGLGRGSGETSADHS